MFKSIANTLLVLLGLGSDVITVTTGTPGTAGNVAGDLQTYFAAQLLEVAELITVLDQFGDKQPIPANSSRTIQFTREEKFTVSSSPTQLTEGVAPFATGLTVNQFQAVMQQYGFLVRLSDLAVLTAKHPIVAKTIQILGLNAAELYDQLIYNVLSAATNQYFPNHRAGVTTLLASDTVGYTDLVSNEATLFNNGGRPFADGDFVLVCSPDVYAGLLKDADFKSAAQLRAPERIWKGEVQDLGGIRVVRSNAPGFAASTQTNAGFTHTFFNSFAIARFAYQISDLQNLKVFVVAPGGQADPLQQSHKIGYKFAFNSVITNQNWIQLITSAGASSFNN